MTEPQPFQEREPVFAARAAGAAPLAPRRERTVPGGSAAGGWSNAELFAAGLVAFLMVVTLVVLGLKAFGP